MSASLDALKDDAEPAPANDPDAATSVGTGVDDLISKAAVAVEGHAASAQLSRARMARLSADAAASLRSAIEGEGPSGPGEPPKGVTSGTRLDVQR
ncbi:MAG: hypothetical protein ACHQSE_03660 [Gemmatimonadales bacterium]